MRHFFFVALCAGTAAAVGCGGSGGPKTYKVTGTVTFDGEPIERGYIIFQPTGAGDRPEGANIEDGRYEVRAMAGMKKVEIRGVRVLEEKGTKGENLEENFVPDRYNAKTELTAEIEEHDANEFDFALESGG